MKYIIWKNQSKYRKNATKVEKNTEQVNNGQAEELKTPRGWK